MAEGWGQPLNSKKFHYFVGGMSLCRKWAYFGKELELGEDDHSANCAACKKKKAKHPDPPPPQPPEPTTPKVLRVCCECGIRSETRYIHLDGTESQDAIDDMARDVFSEFANYGFDVIEPAEVPGGAQIE